MKASRVVGIPLIVFFAVLLAAACSPRKFILKTAVMGTSNYLDAPEFQGTSLDEVAPGVYSFRWTWYRNLIVDTDEGLFVTDPFNAPAAKALAAELERSFPNEPVHTLFYSHYHLDHTRGGEHLNPQRVLGHEKNPVYWEAVNATGVLAQTETINADTTLTIGGKEIQLLYMNDSHSDTIYAVFLPEQKVLWTADMGLVQSFLPFGGPDMYWPGVRSAFQRLLALDFEVFVPSHFDYGTKDDLREYAAFVDDVRQIVLDGQAEYRAQHGFAADTPPQFSRDALGEFFDYAYPKLEDRYGDWHGFDEMALEQVFHTAAAELLGY